MLGGFQRVADMTNGRGLTFAASRLVSHRNGAATLAEQYLGGTMIHAADLEFWKQEPRDSGCKPDLEHLELTMNLGRPSRSRLPQLRTCQSGTSMVPRLARPQATTPMSTSAPLPTTPTHSALKAAQTSW